MILRISLMAAALPIAQPAFAQIGDARITALEERIATQDAQIARLERQLAEQTALLQRLAEARSAAGAVAKASPERVAPSSSQTIGTISAANPVPLRAAGIAGLDISGDLRLREEFNFSDRDMRDRARTVLRVRLRASYAISSTFTAGGQIATGDPDDPNSTDVTLGGFNDDFQVSVDQAWLRYARGGLKLYGGKFPQIFARTDMVWDGDVAPQGVGGTYSLLLGRDANLDARAMHFIIDEAVAGPDSSMTGSQLTLTAPLAPHWSLILAGAYYDYRLRAVAGADSGDFRDNLVDGGRYLSDFNLGEVMLTLSYSGFGESWPLSLVVDRVHNFGAAVDADDGFNVEFVAGRSAAPGDWRFAYNYSEVGVDAVFAAFSHDNLAIATNYRLHGFGIGYVLAPNVVLDANLYHYRPLSARFAGTNAPNDWLNRVRFNLFLQF